MSFYACYKKYKDFNYDDFFKNLDAIEIERILCKDKINEMEYLALLSPIASNYLEEMAQKAHKLTVQNFGKVILLYTPLYLADHCVNQCVYCSFNVLNKFKRKKLTLEEVEKEAEEIAKTGMKHILILTGESRHHSPVSYIKDCVGVLLKYFSSVSIEIYPLETEEYQELVEAVVDGLTIYQEVYNESKYDELHVKGPKKNYLYRLDAPERGCRAGMRTVNIGALLGLDDWRKEAFMTGLHAAYLQNKYLDTEISISLPRIRPHIGVFQPQCPVDDKSFVQIMLAQRIFMPRAGITISTRESAKLRDHLMFLGVTKMSAGSCTAVGGHIHEEESIGQFDISDTRNVDEVKKMLLSKGYQPIFKDWHMI